MTQPAPGTPGAGDDPSSPAAAASTPPPSTGEAAAPESPWQVLQSIWRDLPGLVSDRVELLSLELQRAGKAMLQLLMLVVAVAILGVTTWAVLWAGIVAVLLATGLHLAWALIIVLAVNLLAILMALSRMRALLPRLRLPATRRHLTLSPSPQPAAPSEPTRHDRPDFSPTQQPAAR